MGEYSAKTDPLGAIKENPISHVSYSYGAQVIILNEQGRIEKAVSAFDVGTPVNIQSVEGQIEGGMVMGIGYGVTEKFECVDGYPKSRFGTIGFMRATEAPELEVILCQPKEADKLPFSLGAKGCGELCMIPTAPACAHAITTGWMASSARACLSAIPRIESNIEKMSRAEALLISFIQEIKKDAYREVSFSDASILSVCSNSVSP